MIWIFLMGTVVGPMLDAAENYDIKQMTPAIDQALKNRQMRYREVQTQKIAGTIGEDNQGFLQVLREAPGVPDLAASENADRQVIYQAIVDQNQLGAEGMAKVKEVFAEVQREKALPGEFIQLPSGDWIRK